MPKKFYHILLILLILTIPIFSSPDFDGSFRLLKIPMFQKNFLEMILLIIFFYLNYLFLMPLFFNRKKYFIYGVLVLICFLLVVFIPDLLIDESSLRRRGGPLPPSFGQTKPVFVFARALLPFSFSLLSSMFLQISMQKKEVEMQKSKAELLNIKYQLQPHFLFNILNNIYSLSLLKSDAAPESILKLSNVMRYVVTESDRDLVLLEKEIEYIKDYIALQLIRVDDSLDFSFTKEGEAENLEIAPMILVNFIENAFKYGFNAEEKSKISVSIFIKENTLDLKVDNDKVVSNNSERTATNIGLKNTIKRLEMLYPNQHSLTITDTEKSFSVSLKIYLI